MDVELPDCCCFTSLEQNPGFLMVAVNGKPRNEIVQASPKSTNKVFLSPAMGYFTLLNILGYDEKIGWRRTKDGSIFSTVMIER